MKILKGNRSYVNYTTIHSMDILFKSKGRGIEDKEEGGEGVADYAKHL